MPGGEPIGTVIVFKTPTACATACWSELGGGIVCFDMSTRMKRSSGYQEPGTGTA